MNKFPKYFSASGDDYPGCNKASYRTIKILEFLNGSELSDDTINWIHSARPSKIRILPFLSQYTTNSVHWRVSVHLTIDNKIAFIEQEVEIAR